MNDNDLFWHVCLLVRSAEGGVCCSAYGEYELQEGTPLRPGCHARWYWYKHTHTHKPTTSWLHTGVGLNSLSIQSGQNVYRNCLFANENAFLFSHLLLVWERQPSHAEGFSIFGFWWKSTSWIHLIEHNPGTHPHLLSFYKLTPFIHHLPCTHPSSYLSPTFPSSAAQKVCHLLGMNVTDFTRAILFPRIKVCMGMDDWSLQVGDVNGLMEQD